MDKFYKRPIARFLIINILLFICMFFVFCDHKKQKDRLIGNWYYCDPDSVYNECYLHDDSLFITYNLLVGVVTFNYKISSDSLTIYNSTIKSHFYINDTSFKKILLIMNDSIVITLNKIDKKIEYWKSYSDDIHERNEFLQKFARRSQKKCNCD